MQENNTQIVNLILERLKSSLKIDTDTQLAVALSVKNNVLSNWKSRNSIDFSAVFTLCEKEKLDLNFIINGKGLDGYPNGYPNGYPEEKTPVVNEPRIKYLPTVVTVNSDDEDVITIVGHKVAAGYLNGYADPEYIEKLPVLAAPGFRGGTHRAFEIRGNSMPPMHTGSISIGRYEEDLTGIRNRRLYIVVTKNEGIVLKRVINVPEEQKLVLISDNPNKKEYGNYTVDYEDVLQLWYWRAALIREVPDPSDLYNRLNDFEAKITLLEEDYRKRLGK